MSFSNGNYLNASSSNVTGSTTVRLITIQLEPLFENIVSDRKSMVNSFFKQLIVNIIDSYKIELEVTEQSNTTISSDESSEFETEAVAEGSMKSSMKSSGIGFETKSSKISFKNGNYYEGATFDHLMHGVGTFAWADGTRYEGEFVNGYPTGKGKMVLPNQDVYEGELCKGMFHGEGISSLSRTQCMYKGQWNAGRKHGYGWILYKPESWYEGEWQDDLRHGYGTRKSDDGDRYRGYFKNNKTNGSGEMYWSNKDYYKGEWKDNKPHGYGEYIWKMVFNKEFCFPSYNWYKGTWHEGARHGIGIMNFGTECGSKYAGQWSQDKKHGPGIVVCGNGLAIANDPLFEDDKPIHKSSMNVSSNPKALTEPNELYKEIVALVNQQVPLGCFEQDILEKIRESGASIPSNFFVKTCDSSLENKKWCCLQIPIHTVAEEVDMDYYIDMIISHVKSLSAVQHDVTPSSIHAKVTSFITNGQPDPSLERNLLFGEGLDDAEPSRSLSLLSRTKEKEMLKYCIMTNMSKLRNVYDVYANLVVKNPTSYRPTLVRLFLWQLLRDVGLNEYVSIAEVDLLFSGDPKAFAESDHDPFELIYFWQFLQYLMACAWLVYRKSVTLENTARIGVVVHIFKTFLFNDIFLNLGGAEGQALYTYLDHFPIKSVYKLYRSLGEPHTIQTFLYNTLIKKGQDPPYYCPMDQQYNATSEGYNAVPINEISYLKNGESFPPKQVEPTTTATQETKETDVFTNTLYTFRPLGRRRILKKILSVCPRAWVLNEKKRDFNHEYKLVFLEFYEILIALAQEKLEFMENAKRIDLVETQSIITKQSIVSQSSMKRTHSKRKSRGKKSIGFGSSLAA